MPYLYLFALLAVVVVGAASIVWRKQGSPAKNATKEDWAKGSCVEKHSRLGYCHGISAVVVVLAIRLTAPADRPLRFVFRFLTQVGRRKVLAVVLVGLLGAGVSAGLAARNGMPLPDVPDEFSYLLAADTFCARPTDQSPPPDVGPF